ncbi:MAG TPA: nucleotidyltransferase domain-containing protein [Polyangiaceae bacterium]|nr:nucleotidyltransferase domain-containing protein [Polyangiaceae bacterium]
MLNAGEIAELESQLARSAARHRGVRLALLFGSRATGRAQPTSDIDLAIGLKNVVAHGYARLDVEMCFQAATEGVADLDAFARELTSWAAV